MGRPLTLQFDATLFSKGMTVGMYADHTARVVLEASASEFAEIVKLAAYGWNQKLLKVTIVIEDALP